MFGSEIERGLHLEEADHFWATWRPHVPLEAEPAEFDRADCLKRLAKVRVGRSHWRVEYRFDEARIAPALSREEAHFWLEALFSFIEKGGSAADVVHRLEGQDFFGNVASKTVRKRLLKGRDSLVAEIMSPLANLFAPDVLTEMLLDLPVFRMSGPGARTFRLAQGYRRFVLPYLSVGERHRARELVAARLGAAKIPRSLRRSLPLAWYLAAVLGLHDEVARVVRGWPDDHYAGSGGRKDLIQRPQLLLFGLGDPNELVEQIDRLELSWSTTSRRTRAAPSACSSTRVWMNSP